MSHRAPNRGSKRFSLTQKQTLSAWAFPEFFACYRYVDTQLWSEFGKWAMKPVSSMEKCQKIMMTCGFIGFSVAGLFEDVCRQWTLRLDIQIVRYGKIRFQHFRYRKNIIQYRIQKCYSQLSIWNSNCFRRTIDKLYRWRRFFFLKKRFQETVKNFKFEKMFRYRKMMPWKLRVVSALLSHSVSQAMILCV